MTGTFKNWVKNKAYLTFNKVKVWFGLKTKHTSHLSKSKCLVWVKNKAYLTFNEV